MSTGKGEVIELRNVWKSYSEGHVNALQDFSVKIYNEDFVAIVGPSGSGKSTCMHLIGLLDIPTRGKIFLDGKDISKFSENKLARLRGKKIGFIFQQFNLIPTLTALENVLLPVMFQNEDDHSRERAMGLLTKVGLGERVNHRPSQMSGGEQQRVAIARALINNPEIVLADEPTGNLDSKTGKQIMSLLVDLHEKDKKTLIVITHDPRVADFAHKTINIIDGKIAHDHQMERSFLWRKGENNK
ncbi:MAG: ABC transporter ATP-binding protein [Nanoarchaeota archaeon]|nr:ABC transporter ATP-binding protein [Nanoarchaeota archaeon]